MMPPQSLFRLRSLILILILSVLVAGCGVIDTRPPELNGRWQVISNQGLSVPETLFWFSMDYLEFREDGTVLSLIDWPPDTGTEIRLNKSVTYTRVNKDQIAISGYCRDVEPCTGTYTLAYNGDMLRLNGEGGELVLERVGSTSADVPSMIPGPSPSPTASETSSEDDNT